MSLWDPWYRNNTWRARGKRRNCTRPWHRTSVSSACSRVVDPIGHEIYRRIFKLLSSLKNLKILACVIHSSAVCGTLVRVSAPERV